MDTGRDDHALYGRIRAGEHAAFDILFRRYYSSLTRFAERYVKDIAVAEDLVQTVFVRLWNHRARWDIRTSVKSYLFSSVHYEVLHDARHERIKRAHAAQTASQAEPSLERWQTDDALMADTLEHAAARAIDAMPERRRMAYVLRRQHDLSYAEIATLMGVTVKTVEHQIALALKDLRHALADWLE